MAYKLFERSPILWCVLRSAFRIEMRTVYAIIAIMSIYTDSLMDAWLNVLISTTLDNKR